MSDWRDHARCQGMDTDTWYPVPGDHARVTWLKSVCARCTVRVDCLQYALERGEQHGVWGGMSTKERNRLHRKVTA